MRGCVWAALLRCIPPEQHNILMLVTTCGTEIALQNVLRIDDELLAIRGRLAGSQDSGRLYFVPLSNIDYFGFNRMVKDEEYEAMFGKFQPPPLETVAAPPPSTAPEPPPPSEEPISTPSLNTPLKASMPIKSAILERFRSRGPGSSNGTV